MTTNTNGRVLSLALVVASLFLLTEGEQGETIACQSSSTELGGGCSGSRSKDDWDYRYGSSNDPNGKWTYNWGKGSGPDGSTSSYGSGAGLSPDGNWFGYGWGISTSPDHDKGSPSYGGGGGGTTSTSTPGIGNGCGCGSTEGSSEGSNVHGPSESGDVAQGPAPSSQPWQDGMA